MKTYDEDNLLLLSGIQHFAFCKRQWGLIHIEQQWAENARTTEGLIMHKKAHDSQQIEKRGDILVTRGLRVLSKKLGVCGECDVVEFRKSETGIILNGYGDLWAPYPIEYKNGEPKENHADELQLCAQAMCLEEMLLCEIPEGSIFYGRTKRRHVVCFSRELRSMVKVTLDEMHDMFSRGITPKARCMTACNACSLINICVPTLNKCKNVKAYIDEKLGDDNA